MRIDLRKGDCLELMKSIPDKSVDFILADPPYEKTKAKWDRQIPLDKVWKQYQRIIKDHGCIAIFGLEPFSSAVRLSNSKLYRYDWIWKK